MPPRRRGDDVGVIVLGREADEDNVVRALRAAAATDGYVGFAIGRTIWDDPLERSLAGSVEPTAQSRTSPRGMAASSPRFVASESRHEAGALPPQLPGYG